GGGPETVTLYRAAVLKLPLCTEWRFLPEPLFTSFYSLFSFLLLGADGTDEV
ncbi:hypothetical protein KI387_001016, partial [Taxus chinensis]